MCHMRHLLGTGAPFEAVEVPEDLAGRALSLEEEDEGAGRGIWVCERERRGTRFEKPKLSMVYLRWVALLGGRVIPVGFVSIDTGWITLL